MALSAKELRDHPVLRFLLVGGLNTLITAGIVVLLSFVLPGWLAFTIAFTLGIAFSVAATGRWVFRTHVSAARAIRYVIAYLLIYLFGLGVVQLLALAGAPSWASALSVLVTAPLSFLAGRYVFRDRPVGSKS